MIPSLSDDRVALRPWRDEDLAAIAEASRDPEVTRWTRVPEHNTEAQVRAFRADQAPWLLSGRYAAWVVAESPGGPVRGVIDVRIELEGAMAEIGYWMGAAGRGRGLMSAAVRLVTRWALEQRGLARVQILAAPENPASQRVAERAGFRREGVLRSYRDLKGTRQDLVVFSRLPGDGDGTAG